MSTDPDAPLDGDASPDTVTAAVQDLRADGFTADFLPTDDGMLRCGECGNLMDPAEIAIRHRLRFEGDTNPDDRDIVLALECGCGCRGIFTAAYGAHTPAPHAAVLRRLAANPG